MREVSSPLKAMYSFILSAEKILKLVIFKNLKALRVWNRIPKMMRFPSKGRWQGGTWNKLLAQTKANYGVFKSDSFEDSVALS